MQDSSYAGKNSLKSFEPSKEFRFRGGKDIMVRAEAQGTACLQCDCGGAPALLRMRVEWGTACSTDMRGDAFEDQASPAALTGQLLWERRCFWCV